MSKCILATGGAGYIGSHVVARLLAAGHRVVILDNFENSEHEVIDRIAAVAGCRVSLVEGDVRDTCLVERTLRRHRVDAVIHLAGKKSVGESVANPLLYFEENLNGAISLLTAMQNAGVMRLVFSSSATVYGVPEKLPISEDAPTGITNPYGRTKLMIEHIIDDCVASFDRFFSVSLRYFNPVGAHCSGLLGEVPRGMPNNLFPYVVQAALGEQPYVRVFGNDYETSDGTGIRDYLHVEDLASGHVAAVDALFSDRSVMNPHQRLNLGTGRGYSVLEVLSAFSRTCGFKVPYRIVERRPGDVAASVADADLARRLLGWKARHELERMCRDQWTFALEHARRTNGVRPEKVLSERMSRVGRPVQASAATVHL